MKAAISTDSNMVSSHFGRCPEFTIATIENGTVNDKQTIPNPGHHPGFLPEFLHSNGVGAIIAGGMGPTARDLFAQKGIKTILGISGSVDDILEKLASGTLEGGQSSCQPGGGKGYGIDKTQCDHGENHKHEGC